MGNHISQSLSQKLWVQFFFGLMAFIQTGCATQKPREHGEFKSSDLVEIVKLDSSIKLDIRYATSNNFTGRPVYKQARAFLQRPAAEALVAANQRLNAQGLGIMIFDGYRPWRITKLFWDITPDSNKRFVADPKKGSRHNRGAAVDCTLYELSTGLPINMPGEYDETTNRSYPDYTGGTHEQRAKRDLLIAEMTSAGFTVYKYEWWHFDFNGWEQWRIQDIPFSKL